MNRIGQLIIGNFRVDELVQFTLVQQAQTGEKEENSALGKTSV